MRLISTNWFIYKKEGTKFQIKVVQHKTNYMIVSFLSHPLFDILIL